MSLRYIFHISDLHIRNGDIKQSRYEEYNYVFDKLFKSLKQNIKKLKISPDDFVIIVSGDIFHNKNNIANHGLLLYKTFIHNITKIGTTIIFHGNHDKNQSEINQPSLVSSTIEIENLILLDKSTTFVIDDVCFSYISIDDTLDSHSTRGRLENLPQFNYSSSKYKVALFHGTFANVSLYNGTCVGEEHRPYPFEWIKDFDFAVLGDIHLRQFGTYKNTLWGYSGSLIQQNYGEDIINHGYMIWDLFNKTIEEVNVFNKYGLVNVKQEDDIILIKNRGKYVPIDSFTKDPNFPSHLYIKLYSYIDIEKLQGYNFTFDIINRIEHKRSLESNHSNDNDSIYIDKGDILKYFHSHLTPEQHNILNDIVKNYDTLLFNHDEYPEDLHTECSKKNKEISALISNCIKSDDIKQKINEFTIHYLEWENMYCFQGVNYINFENSLNNTFLIAGNNGTGKSAIYDILVLSIWGEITYGRQNNISQGIINHHSNDGYVKVKIISNNKIYEIVRRFSKVNNVLQKKVTIYENGIQIKKENACAEFIKKTFGTIDDFLTQSMITQTIDNDILKMNYKDCLALIDKTSNLDYIYDLFTLIKGCLNKYKDMKKTIDNKKSVYENIIIKESDDLDDKKSIYQKLIQKEISMTNEYESIKVDIHDDSDFVLLIDNNENITDEEYNKIKINKKEYSNYLYNQSIESIIKYSSLYDSSITYDNDTKKPCEKKFIEEEKERLSKYKNMKEYTDDEISVLKNRFENIKKERSKIDEIIINLNHNKPVVVSSFQSPENISDIIDELYINFNTLKTYCIANNLIMKYNDTSIYNCNYDISFDEYKQSIKFQKTVTTTIEKHNKYIEKEQAKLDELYEYKYSRILNNPDSNCVYKTSKKIIEVLNSYDEIKLQINLHENEKILNSDSFNELNDSKDKLININTELNTLITNEDYDYDPECKFCCKRPWVQRIKTLTKEKMHLENIINKLEVFDYRMVLENTEIIRKDLKYIEYLKSMLHYYQEKEKYDKICKCIDKTSNNIQEKKNKIKELNEEYELYSLTIEDFNKQSVYLYNEYVNIQYYNQYIEWKKDYENYLKVESKIIFEHDEISEQIYHIENILPRKRELDKIISDYENWEKQHNSNLIYCSHMIVLINTYEYKLHKNKKQMITDKKNLKNKIDENHNEIIRLGNEIAKLETIYCINEKNKMNKKILISADNKISNIISTIEIIINKFKTYRKDIYNNYILKKIVDRSNKYIENICHVNTKPFKLDYYISELKDIIHINWLVKIDDDNSQYISINQASGFQKFVMSLALRMSLFGNRQCSQLFFDEGFTACDKQNISIIPSFLKGLLKIYKSITLVSHIEIIQDNVDIISNIVYNNNSSMIRYE